MNTLQLRGLQKQFGDHVALSVPELELAYGALTVLLGPSGCGKTTLLRVLAGLERPDAGCVTLGDRILTAPTRHLPAEARGIGLVFQDHALFPHLRVADNIAFGLPRGRTARAERRRRVAELIELVGLAGLERRFPHELSGGQQQRVALARALAPAPEVLLLDEPFSGLDLETRVRVRGEVREILRAAGATALLVTHDQDEALSLADHLLVMRDGQIVQSGSPTSLYREPASAWVAGFLGEVDVLPGVAQSGVVRCELGELRAAVPDGEVMVGLRPESLALAPPAEDGGLVATLQRTEFFGHDLVLHVMTPGGAPVRARVMGPALVAESAHWAALPAGAEIGVRLVGEARVFAGAESVAAEPLAFSRSSVRRGE